MGNIAKVRQWVSQCAISPLLTAFAGVLCWLFLIGQQDAAAELTPDEQRFLAFMDAEVVAALIALEDKAKALQDGINQLEAAAKEVTHLVNALDNSENESELTEGVFELASALQRIAETSPEFDKHLKYREKIAPLLKKSVEGWRTASYDAQAVLDTGETEFLDEAKEFARSVSASELLELFDAELFGRLEQIRNPAQFAKNFAEKEIAAWLTEPREAAGVTFRIEKTDPSKSLFAPDANIAIVLEYQEGMSVAASGLYFKYEAGKAPQPQFDKLLVEQSVDSLANSTLKFLGQAGASIPTDFGLPIKILDPKFNGFDANSGKPPASLSFTVEIANILDFAPSMKLTAKGVTIDTKGNVTVEEGFTFEDKVTKVPIGATSLILDGYTIILRPEDKEKTITVGTHIAPASGKDSSVSLKIDITFGFPIKKVAYEGHLILAGGTKVGKVDGEISAEEINGTLLIPEESELPLDNILKAKLAFKLDKSGFDANGIASIFRCYENQFELVLGFDGQGHFTSRDTIKLAGISVDSSLTVQVQDGFRHVELDAVFAINVDLPPKQALFHAEAAVAVHAATSEGIQVTARAMGAEASFEVNSLKDITPLKIAEELAKELDDILQNIAKAAAKWEKDKKELLAKWDNHWRETLHEEAKKLGLDKVETGNEEVDRMLGDIAREGKDTGKWAADVWKKGGKEASEFVKNPADKLKDLPSNVGRELTAGVENLASGVGNLFGGGGNSGEPSGPSPAEKRASDLHGKVEKKLEPLVQAINQAPNFRKTPQKVSGGSKGRRYAQSSELHIDFDNSVGVSEGQGNGAIGLTIAMSGFSSRIVQREKSTIERQHGSEIVSGTVQFTSLVARDPRDIPEGQTSERAKARIGVDKFEKDPSGLNAHLEAYVAIQQLVQLHLPEVEIEGPQFFAESQLAIKNQTEEPLRAWMQWEYRTVEEHAFRWRWTPGEPGSNSGHQVTVQPGETKLVLLDPAKVESGSEAASDANQPDTADLRHAPIRGRRVRIWSESEGGDRWERYRSRDLWLVQPSEKYGGKRAYFAEKIKTFTHTIDPHTGPRIFSERRVVLRNSTPEPLEVKLQYRTREGDKTFWRTLDPITLPPGKIGSPVGKDGMRIRASQIRFTAQGEHFYFGKHKSDPLYLVEKSDGRRMYHAEAVGVYEHAFDVRDIEGEAKGSAGR